jgi:alkylated DNA repair protein (DNA oxidative demethylase)
MFSLRYAASLARRSVQFAKTRNEKGHMTLDLFSDCAAARARQESLCPGALILRGFAAKFERELLAALQSIVTKSPFRHMTTPGGYRMSVAMTNCGSAGWVTDKDGYRYDPIDPMTGDRWPSMPAGFSDLAARAANEAGFAWFSPDACLINRYEPGARLSLHQDKNEWDFNAPIVSVSLGLSAVFLFGGACRSDKAQRVPLHHGDTVVWGGAARLFYHGVMPLKDGCHSALDRYRVNLTFRKAS